jgi:hypothetical protein
MLRRKGVGLSITRVIRVEQENIQIRFLKKEKKKVFNAAAASRKIDGVKIQ